MESKEEAEAYAASIGGYVFTWRDDNRDDKRK
jgi:hypothetical protein